MKTLCFLLPLILSSLFNAAFAQAVDTSSMALNAQKSFDMLKTLAGNWQGPVTVDNPDFATNKPVNVTMQVASQGNALIHELMTQGTQEVTMFYMDSNKLMLTHYCDFPNRPRMVAQPSSNKNKIEFDFIDMSGIDAPGHVSHAVFTIIDINHHLEDWTFAIQGKKPFHAIMDLQRMK